MKKKLRMAFKKKGVFREMPPLAVGFESPRARHRSTCPHYLGFTVKVEPVEFITLGVSNFDKRYRFLVVPGYLTDIFLRIFVQRLR